MKTAYTQKELQLLEELRKKVEDILECDYEKTDDYLITWLRYANFDVRKAEEALRKNKKWRKENKMDQILLEEMKDLHADYPVVQGGIDKEGCPIMVIRLQGDIRKIVDTSPDGKSRYIRYMMKHCEQTVSIVRTQHALTEGKVNHFCGLVDMEGFCFRQMMSTKVVSSLSQVAMIAEHNYPQLAKVVYVVNAPKTLKFLLNIMKPFLSADTLGKLRLYDTDKKKWKEALLKDISEDQIPSFLL